MITFLIIYFVGVIVASFFFPKDGEWHWFMFMSWFVLLIVAAMHFFIWYMNLKANIHLWWKNRS